MKYLIVIFAFLAVAQCSPTGAIERCEGWPVVASESVLKNIDNYNGLHYMQYRSPHEKHTDVKCIHIKAKHNDENGFNYEKHVTNKENKEIKTEHKTSFDQLDVAYINDKLVIRCRVVEAQPHLHILTRDRIPSEEVTKEINTILENHKIDLAKLEPVDQKNCDH